MSTSSIASLYLPFMKRPIKAEIGMCTVAENCVAEVWLVGFAASASVFVVGF